MTQTVTVTNGTKGKRAKVTDAGAASAKAARSQAAADLATAGKPSLTLPEAKVIIANLLYRVSALEERLAAIDQALK